MIKEFKRCAFFLSLLLAVAGISPGQQSRDLALSGNRYPSGWTVLGEGDQTLGDRVQRTGIRAEFYQQLGFQNAYSQVFQTPGGRAGLDIEKFKGAKEASRMIEAEKEILSLQKRSFALRTACGAPAISHNFMGLFMIMFARGEFFVTVGGTREDEAWALVNQLCSSLPSQVGAPRGRKGSSNTPIVIFVVAFFVFLFSYPWLKSLFKKKPRAAYPPPSTSRPPGRPTSRPAAKTAPQRTPPRTQARGPSIRVAEPQPKPAGPGPKIAFQEAPTEPAKKEKIKERGKEKEEEKKEEPRRHSLTLTARPTRIEAGGKARVTARLTDQNKEPLAGESVSFSQSPALGELVPGSATTDSFGGADAVFQAGQESGQAIVKATSSQAFDQKTIKVFRVRELKIESSPRSIKADGREKSRIKVILLDDEYEKVPDYEVKVQVYQGRENRLVQKIALKTDARGVVSLEAGPSSEAKDLEVLAYTRTLSAKDTIEVEGGASFQVLDRSRLHSVFVQEASYRAGKGLLPEAVEKVKVTAGDGSPLAQAVDRESLDFYLPALVGWFGFREEQRSFYSQRADHYQRIKAHSQAVGRKGRERGLGVAADMAASIDDIINILDQAWDYGETGAAVLTYVAAIGSGGATVSLSALGWLAFKVLGAVSGLPVSAEDLVKQVAKRLVLGSDYIQKVKDMGGHMKSLQEAVDRSGEKAAKLASLWRTVTPSGSESGGGQISGLLARGEKTAGDEFLEANKDYFQSYSDFIESVLDLGDICLGYYSLAKALGHPAAAILKVLLQKGPSLMTEFEERLARLGLAGAAKKEMGDIWTDLKNVGPETALVRGFLMKLRKKNWESRTLLLSQVDEERKRQAEDHRRILDLARAMKDHYVPRAAGTAS
jgi:hypothetical protein